MKILGVHDGHNSSACLLENGEVKPGLYVQTGHKRVYWARRKNYTHIEGYYVTDREDKAKIRSKLHIPHTDIPR